MLLAIRMHKKVKDLIGEHHEGCLESELFHDLEKELYRIDRNKETLYLPGGYAGLIYFPCSAIKIN